MSSSPLDTNTPKTVEYWELKGASIVPWAYGNLDFPSQEAWMAYLRVLELESRATH